MTEIKKKMATFNVIGMVNVTDYTFKLNQSKEGSTYKYNAMNLKIDCGEKSGIIDIQLMGGFNTDRNNVIYAKLKNQDGTANYTKDGNCEIDWEERFNNEVISNLADTCFYKVGVEKDENDKTVYTSFLAPYDAIEYLSKNLKNNAIVNVSGVIKLSEYKNSITKQLEVKNIALSKATDKKDFRANFKFPILVDSDSIGEIDLNTNIAKINARVLEYFSKFNGNNEFKKTIAVPMEFDYDISKFNDNNRDAALKALFIPEEDIDEVIMEGDIVSKGNVITPTLDEIPADIQKLVALGVYTEEEAIMKCTETSKSIVTFHLTKPQIRMVDCESGGKIPTIVRTNGIYKESDLVVASSNDDTSNMKDSKMVEQPKKEENKSDDAWLQALGLDK